MKTSLGIVMAVWIPTEERLKQLGNTLVQLHGEVGPDDCVCVMDECSPLRGQVVDLIKSLQKDFRCPLVCRTADIGGDFRTRHTAPWCLAASRNQGAAVIDDMSPLGVSGYAFLDSDCAPLTAWRGFIVDWLSTHRGVGFGRTVHAKHPGALAHDGEVVHAIGSLTLPGNVDEEPVQVTSLLCVADPVDPRLKAIAGLSDWARELPWFPLASLMEQGGGGNMCVSAGMFRDVGGFDEAYCGGFGWEETDLAVRVYQAGGIVHYISSASVLHQYHERGPAHWGDIQRNARLFRDRTGMFTGQRLPVVVNISDKVGPPSGQAGWDLGFNAGWSAGFGHGANAIRGKDPHISILDAESFLVLNEDARADWIRNSNVIRTDVGNPTLAECGALHTGIQVPRMVGLADRPVNWAKQFQDRTKHLTLGDVAEIMTWRGIEPLFEPALDNGSDLNVSVADYLDALDRRASLIVKVLEEEEEERKDIEEGGDS